MKVKTRDLVDGRRYNMYWKSTDELLEGNILCCGFQYMKLEDEDGWTRHIGIEFGDHSILWMAVDMVTRSWYFTDPDDVYLPEELFEIE